MVSKRKSFERQRSGKVPIQDHKRSYDDTKQAPISGLRNVINALWLNDHSSYLEAFVRRVVREELEKKIKDQAHLFPRKRVNEAGISGAKPFKLCFLNKLPKTIYTRSNIVAEDESLLQIALFDVRTKSVVKEGPLSSLKIEICVLNGEFGSDDSEEWTEEEFNSNISREREGREPLLIGERFITLKNGVACITKIAISDNSRWQRSRRFRIGVKGVPPTSIGEKIQEGRSEPVIVKDNRGECYKKHFPPFLDDELWRLKKIAKEGRIQKQFSLHGIHTVKDLLRQCISNEESLYKMLDIPKKSWLAITDHAKTCVVDDYKLYSYYSQELQIGLLFNSIYILVGVTFDWEIYYSPDILTPQEKHLVGIVKQQAYKNVNNLKMIDETKLNCLNLDACLKKARQSDTPNQCLQHMDMPTAQGEAVTFPDYSQPSISTSYTDEVMHDGQIYADSEPSTREMPHNSNVFDEFSSEIYNEEDSCDFDGSCFPFLEGGYSIENEKWEPTSGMFFGSYDGEEFSPYSTFINSSVDISSNGKPKAAWCKIGFALKWVISAKRRHAAAKKNAQLFYHN
ncbi:calmodulin-binding protein 60 D-like [Vigna unguiculata]|uniref:calmodulin-binding protein 60 D-like n=1 Tax=Vigna unguiculata TaxID=3917 RepID=UPI001016D0CB|nr:calmodulin-binding protein 60 D-like [Vigna unguiculata]